MKNEDVFNRIVDVISPTLQPDELDVLFCSSISKSNEIDLLEEQRDRLFEGLKQITDILSDDSITDILQLRFKLVQAVGKCIKKAR